MSRLLLIACSLTCKYFPTPSVGLRPVAGFNPLPEVPKALGGLWHECFKYFLKAA